MRIGSNQDIDDSKQTKYTRSAVQGTYRRLDVGRTRQSASDTIPESGTLRSWTHGESRLNCWAERSRVEIPTYLSGHVPSSICTDLTTLIYRIPKFGLNRLFST